MKRALAIALGPLSLAIALGLYVQPRAAGEDRPNIRPRLSRSDGAARTSRSGQDSFAFFEFAPTGGAGMGAPCACTTPTGAKGETLTFTRASNATCTKTSAGGLATTGIANGDLVVCTNDQPRVEYDSNGTLGLLVESSRTNSIVRSEEIDNVAWASDNAIVAAPTVTANATSSSPLAAPTSLPERIQIPATDASGTQYSRRYQTVAVTAAICSFYVLGNGTSGTVDVCQQSTGSSCTACAYNSTTWTRCAAPVSVGSSVNCTIGNMSLAAYNGGVARSAQDIFVTAAQAEAGAYATSYIPTVAASVTRSVETGYLTIAGLTAPDPVSIAASVSRESTLATGASYSMAACLQDTGINYLCSYLGVATNAAVAEITQGGGPARADSSAVTGIITNGRLAASNVGTSIEAFLSGVGNGATTTGLAATWTPARVWLGTWSGGGFQLDGIVSRVCVDPDPSRCR